MAGPQKVFNHLTTAVLLVCAIYFNQSISAYSLLHRSKPHDFTDLPQYHQVIIVPLLSGAMCFIYKKAVVHILSPAFLLIAKDQHDKQLAKERAEKASENFAKSSFYVCSSIWAYSLIKDTNFAPWFFGGEGSVSNCFEKAPLTP